MLTLRNEGASVSGDVNTKTECGIYQEMPELNSEAGKACKGWGHGSKGWKRHAPVFLATQGAEAGEIVSWETCLKPTWTTNETPISKRKYIEVLPQSPALRFVPAKPMLRSIPHSHSHWGHWERHLGLHSRSNQIIVCLVFHLTEFGGDWRGTWPGIREWLCLPTVFWMQVSLFFFFLCSGLNKSTCFPQLPCYG